MTSFKKSMSFIALMLFANAFGMETENVNIFTANYRNGNEEIPKITIARDAIFPYVTGMLEPDFVEEYKKTGKMPKFPTNMQKLVNKMSHSTLTLQELRNAAQNKLSSIKDGQLSIIHVDVVKYPDLRHLTDIGALQGNHPGAVFQTASRPNGLEGQQRSFLNNRNNFNANANGFNNITKEFAVQGEEAQISAAIRGICAIYRVQKQINFFGQLNIGISAEGNLTNLNPDFLNNNSMEFLSNLICVDHWKNVPVTTGYANVLYQSEGIKKEQNLNANARARNIEDANALIIPPHLISQVNVSALDVNKYRGKTQELFSQTCGKNWMNTMDKVAQAALRAAYEGTIYCALLEDKKDLFLTLVGGGSFGNKLDWIVDTLKTLQSIIKQSGLNIRLVVVEVNGHLENKDNQNAWQELQKLAKTTGGMISSNGKIVC